MSIVYRGLLQVWKTKSTFWENSRICLLCKHSYLIRHQFMLFFDLLRKWWNSRWQMKWCHLTSYDFIWHHNYDVVITNKNGIILEQARSGYLINLNYTSLCLNKKENPEVGLFCTLRIWKWVYFNCLNSTIP